jgi:DNA-binding LytR/AlgR family response regulator
MTDIYSLDPKFRLVHEPTSEGPKKCLFTYTAVAYFETLPNGTRIHFTSGKNLVVNETLDDLFSSIDGAPPL